MGSTIAPIFFNTAQDSGALPIICDVINLEMGDEFEIHPYEGKIIKMALQLQNLHSVQTLS